MAIAAPIFPKTLAGFYRLNFFRYHGAKWLLWSAIMLANTIVFRSFPPLYTKWFVEILEQYGRVPDALPYQFAVFAITVILIMLSVQMTFTIAERLRDNLVPKSTDAVSRDLYRYAYNQTVSFYTGTMPGKIANQITLIANGFRRTFSDIFGILLGLVVVFILNMGLIFQVDTRVGIVLFSGILLRFFWVLFRRRPYAKAVQNHSEMQSILSGKLLDGLSNFVIVKLFAGANKEESSVDKTRREYVGAVQKSRYQKRWFFITPYYFDSFFITMAMYFTAMAFAGGEIAIADAKKYGLLGKNIFGSGFDFELHIRLGAGAFVCGEETALMTSIEGNRGEPRPRPPYPAVKGLFGKPTTENNVETFVNVPQIILRGAAPFAEMGTEKSKGSKVFALGGNINNTGLVEIPMGTKLREVIYEIGGGIPEGRGFKAVQTGGPSGGCIPAAHLDIEIDYDNLSAIGCMIGSGGMIVLDDSKCMVDIARFFLDFTVDESCGKCSPCRIGTKRMLEILDKIIAGNGTLEDVDKLEELAAHIKESSLCGLGQTSPNPVLATLRFFREEYVAHVTEHKCPAGVCKAMLTYVIDPEKCTGCTLCARVCPTDAISGELKKPHVIDPGKCIKCGACETACKRAKAIYKA